MKYDRIRTLPGLYFTTQEIASLLGIRLESARVLCSRYVRKQLLIRLKRNLYLLPERWDRLTERESFQIANLLQVPSYISLTTALAYYELTTQWQQDYYESIALRRSLLKSIRNKTFRYTTIPAEYYFGFKRETGIFIAEPEKALLDSLYLQSLGRYQIDWDALEIDKLNAKIVTRYLASYPDRVKKMWRHYAGP
jgi:predicted transcriptional regulator of viral defense system